MSEDEPTKKPRRFPIDSMSSDDGPETEHLLGSQRQLPTVSATIGIAGRRQSLTAPPSPTDSRKKPNRHNYMNQLHHLIHWKEIWGDPHKAQSLQRSESMVSLACFKTLAQLATAESPAQLQQYLATNSHVNVDDRDENGTTALMCASECGQIAAVRLLLAAGADPNAADEDGWTSLALAARGGHVAVVKELLDAMAKVDPRDCGGWTPLMWASYKGHEEVVAVLLEKGADVHAHGNYNITSLVWAAGRGHSGVVRRLLAAGARASSCDKYATSALTWAARAGDVASCAALLQAGADVSSPGMHCWTPLLQAAQGNHVEIVLMLLEHKPNVNALDENGCTALAIACKEGFYDVAVALINSGAYINVQDHSKDTPLIHAVKGGHKGIVEALLKKHVDVDLPGKERKTPVYNAVEKGHVAILKLLLASNPDLELATVTGDTPLLRAVRSRNAEMVQLLIERKARVSVTDNRGDTALHIAMRARCKQIVEILLRNPKNSQLLYKPNKMKETPYNIDMSYNRSILAQVFGARRLNASEPSESMLGYELYSAALADVLAEPSLAVPITVGLYARWGSGKSFLLNKLKEEMLNFASSWREEGWAWSWAVWWASWHAALAVAAATAVAGAPPHASAAVCFSMFAAFSLTFYLLWYLCNRYEWWWADAIGRRCNSLLLLLQVTFCHPPGPRRPTAPPAMPIRFHFTEGMKSGTGGAGAEGEASVIAMIASLAEALECQYGRVCTRLARAFRPTPLSSTAEWKWRRVCCVPHIVTFEVCFTCILVGVAVLIMYLMDSEVDEQRRSIQQGVMLGACALGGCVALANVYTWGRVLAALLIPPRLRLARAARNDSLRQEVRALTQVVSCLDAFTGQQTRLVVVVDALDSCEQEKVLALLNSVHALCCDPDTPFILLLAIDPHIISKAVEVNSRRSFSESNIGGWDYLRNMVQLPFYLQNSALRKVKVAQQTAVKRMQNQAPEDFSTSLQRSVSARRLSSTSEVMSSQERIKNQPTKEAALRARRLRPSDSVASSVASGLHRGASATGGGAAELSRVLLTDDYFSDVNPRSVRRLMNVLYVTGRLLKAFQIEFNWYQLAWWVNLTEQWPFRTSFLIHHHETYHEHIDDSTPLKHIYEKVKPVVGRLRESSVLMELDRDERKLEVFLNFHRATLTAADIKIFLPFTINLDPYIKKLIKEELQQYGTEEEGAGTLVRPPHSKMFHRKHRASPPPPSLHPINNPPPVWVGWADTSTTADPFHQPTQLPPHSYMQPASNTNPYQVLKAAFPNIGDLSNTRLSSLTVNRVCALCREALGEAGEQAAAALRTHHVSGMVLMCCEMDELKPLMNLPFGDWELFKMLITNLRQIEASMPLNAPTVTVISDKSNDSEPDSVAVKPPRKESKTLERSRASNVEKQVTLEEQMICGALQTLNEEAFEDVMLPEPSQEEESELRLPSVMTRGNRRELPAVTFNIECEDSDDEQISFSVPSRNTVTSTAPAVRYRSRPTSLVVADDAAGDVPKNDPAGQDPKLNALKKSVEALKKVSSSERLSRLKDKIMSRGNGSRDRSPPREEQATDDESAPLVSPLSPAAPPRIVSSSSDSSPSRTNSHSKKSQSSPANKRPLGIECNNRSYPDVTASTDFSPRSDCTDIESPKEGACFDMLPEGKNEPTKSSLKPSVERQESDASVSNMVEPYNMRLLSRGATDRLWRQDALDGAPPWPWGDPDSVV